MLTTRVNRCIPYHLVELGDFFYCLLNFFYCFYCFFSPISQQSEENMSCKAAPTHISLYIVFHSDFLFVVFNDKCCIVMISYLFIWSRLLRKKLLCRIKAQRVLNESTPLNWKPPILPFFSVYVLFLHLMKPISRAISECFSGPRLMHGFDHMVTNSFIWSLFPFGSTYILRIFAKHNLLFLAVFPKHRRRLGTIGYIDPSCLFVVIIYMYERGKLWSWMRSWSPSI